MNYITQLNGFFASCERELSLTPNCVSLYVALLHVCNKNNWVKEFTIKNRHFEELIGIHRVKLDEARNKLKQAGLIKYKKDTGNRAGTYTITEFSKSGELLKETESVTQTGTQSVTKSVTQSVTVDGTATVTASGTQNGSLPFYINKPKHKHKHKGVDECENDSADTPKTQTERFDMFWDSYPKKMGKGKAEEAWKKINPDKALFGQILESVEKGKKSKEWTQENGRYIPHPTTWLNRKGWFDEFTPITGNETNSGTQKGDGIDRELLAKTKELERKCAEEAEENPNTESEVLDW